jgi:hypothetical protein
MPANPKINVCPVRISAIPDPGTGELSDKVIRKCDFCQKDVEVTPLNADPLEVLSGQHSFFCRFCLQNGFHTKINKNVLMMSFRGIFGYYYHEYYASPPVHGRKRMAYSQIEDFIQSHYEVGIENPVFRYDPEDYFWFVDFNRVGNSGRRLKIEDVQKTVVNILTCFNLWENVPNVQMCRLFLKYNEAIVNFYQRRYRPTDKPMLIPTLSGIGPIETAKSGLFDKTRGFTRKHFLLK